MNMVLMDYFRNIRRNLMMALEIGILVFLVIITVSTVQEKMRQYQIFKPYEDKKGLLYINSGSVQDAFWTKAEMEMGMVKVSEVLCSSYTTIKVDGDYHDMYSYDKNTLERYSPYLDEGRWLSNLDASDGRMPLVVTQNGGKYRVGQVVSLELYDKDGNEIVSEAYICGVLEEGCNVWNGPNFSFDIDQVDYTGFFENYYYSIEERPCFFTLHNLVEEKGAQTIFKGRYLYIFEDDINEKEWESNYKLIKNRDPSHLALIGLEEFYSNCRKVLREKLLVLIPIILCVSILTLTNVVSATSINFLTLMRYYCIYYLVGMPWSECKKLSLLNGLLTCLLSIPIVLLIYALITRTSFLSMFSFHFGIWQLLGSFLVFSFIVAISISAPNVIWRQQQPTRLIREFKQ